MKTVWRYELLGDAQVRTMPEGAEVLCVQVQAGKPCIWALVDSERPQERRTFCMFGTGHEISDNKNLEYVGSFQLYNDAFVGHVFEVLK